MSAPSPRPLKRPAMPGAGRPKRAGGTAKVVGVPLSADELRTLERLQVERRETAVDVLRSGLRALAMPGAGRPSRGAVKRVAVELTADEAKRLDWLQVELRLTASEVLRVLIADAYDAAKADR